MTSASELTHLRRCVELAAEALAAGDNPFGSVLVSAAGQVLAQDRNREHSDNDPLAHPEIRLARWAATHLPPAARSATTVFTSGEHCPMCAAAHAWAGAGRIVFIASAGQFATWAREFGATPSPVAALSIREIAPAIAVEGPVPELADEVRELHRRRFAR